MTAYTEYKDGQFSWVDVVTPSLDGAKAFYGDLFGWTAADQDTQGGPPYVICSKDGDQVAGMGELSPEMQQMGVPPMWNNYVTMHDLDAAIAKVEGLGGKVTMPPMQVVDAGRMAGIQDPTGGMLMIWEPINHIGAQRCNEPGTLSWNELATRDVDAAKAFYSGMFGWTFEDFPGGPTPYFIIKVGDRQNGGLIQMTEDFGEMPPCWMAYFAVEDTEATVARVTELGGNVMQPPFDIPNVGRMSVVADLHGAVFNVITLNDPDC